MYFKSYDGNVLFTQPDPPFFYFVCMWILLQVAILNIQKVKPRFLLPKSLRPLVIKDYYRYERSFESVADHESAKGMFSSFDSDDQFNKVDKLKEKECAICLF